MKPVSDFLHLISLFHYDNRIHPFQAKIGLLMVGFNTCNKRMGTCLLYLRKENVSHDSVAQKKVKLHGQSNILIWIYIVFISKAVGSKQLDIRLFNKVCIINLSPTWEVHHSWKCQLQSEVIFCCYVTINFHSPPSSSSWSIWSWRSETENGRLEKTYVPRRTLDLECRRMHCHSRQLKFCFVSDFLEH